MEILINDKPYTVNEHTSLSLALELIDIKNQSGIAVAVNNRVIPKAHWPGHTLSPNDKILVIRVAQGG
ncbi:sulfur carrier protein ThiS [Perlabentimonas gracilis]|uniref:sulfur carrier protein ThiS n=1 Tax=Perlabentimonas gracilis TaxID=2715279 RepID=UPI00140A4DF1|nr:sulfur carrier protein ThiS [Perlabentimonas gracilis]NHB67161.1 sulfur carrier protein ThiS [Perlabentimonas gracilis]